MTLSIFDDVNFSLGFDLISLSLPLSLAPHLPLHNQQKWDYPEKERERKRVKKKKKVGVFMAELSFLNRGVSVPK